ncbi:MAG: fimbrillin family protein [Muribaculaceae bacterium]|nr:fimbrillin family protein [Muribaculaceae bacterium]
MVSDYLKYSIYALTAACVIGGCSSDSPDGQTDGTQEVEFTTGRETRSAVTTTSNLTGKAFAVYGDMKPFAAAAEASSTLVFNKEQVAYTSGSWKYGRSIYWFPSHQHSFVALHPFEAIGTTAAGKTTVTNVRYEDGTLSFSYTHPDDYKNASDVLVATHRRDYVPELGKKVDPVNFTFEHTMAVLDIVAKYTEPLVYGNQNNRIEIQEVILDSINVSGNYSIRPDDLTEGKDRTSTHDATGKWTNLKLGNKSFKGTSYNGLVNTVNRTDVIPYRRLYSNSDDFIVLPKEKGDVKMTVKFDLYVNMVKVAEHTLSTVFEDAEWKAGQKIRYELIFTAGEILQGGTYIENYRNVDDLVETIDDMSSDHGAGSGSLSTNNGWTNISLGEQ